MSSTAPNVPWPKLIRWPLIALIWLTLALAQSSQAATGKSLINWQPHNAQAFNKAKTENKFLLLYLEAVWCHWCHVMDAKTYTDPNVAALLQKHYIPVRADHDARPDLAERYRDFGWPATVVLTADGTEIVKRAGYIAPENMTRLLQAIVDDPSPEAAQLSLPESFSDTPLLSSALESELEQRHTNSYDNVHGGLAIAQKFIDADSLAWAMQQARNGDQQEARRAQQTLDAGLKLIDPAFGGAYQYSTHGDWDHAHYEKIMRTQGRYLRVYAQAYEQFGKPEYRQAAEQVAAWLYDFMQSKDGAFYTSQDADLTQGQKSHDYFKLNREQRLAQGIPRIDKHRYAAENGRVIEGLARLYMATGDQRHLDAALQATLWVIKHRGYAGGGFRHNKTDAAGPYLSDTLHMGLAFLALYEATGEEALLHRADKAARFINQYFRHPKAGLVSATDNGTPIKPLPQLDQNIRAAQFLSRLAQIPQLAESRSRNLDLAAHTLRLLVTEDIALSRLSDPGILLAEQAYRRATQQPPTVQLTRI